jgi:hypothetical protein
MLTSYDKAFATIITGIASFVALRGMNLEWLTPELINTLSVAIASFFVWLVPNKAKK